MLRFLPALLLATLVALPAAAQDASLTAVWLHPNRRIELAIGPCGDRLCGTLVWFKNPTDADGQPLLDVNNPDPTLRTRPLMGLTVLRGLRRAGERSWEDGTVYNPNDGQSYDVSISIEDDDTARVRAYVGLPLFGETQVWTRVDKGPLDIDGGIASRR